jgi:hypothetical protein
MNYFLEREQHSELIEMSKLHSQKYINSRGTKVTGKFFLLGENEAELIDVKMREAVNGNYYIIVSFSRKSCNVIGLKSNITFATEQVFVFDYEAAKELCNAYGHELKAKPDDMKLNAYMTAVARRIRTFIGKVVKVHVSYVKELRRDNFGIVEQRAIGVQRIETDVEDCRQKFSFSKIDWLKIRNDFYS